jgi:molybdate transport repressor ModE-like protein
MSLRLEQGSLDLPDLALLVAVADAGSLSGAAKRLRLNHASAWRRLGAVEGRLGVRLFDRSRGGYAPTPAGEEAVGAARRLLEELEALERRLSGQDIRPSGVVRLTTTETLLPLVAPVIAGLRGSHPGVVIELSTANAFLTLTRREADVALRPAAEAPEGLVARRLGDVGTAIYATSAYLAAHDADPLALDWIAPDDSLSHLGSSRWIARNVPLERIVHRAGSLTALAAMAVAGVGLAPLPCLLADPDPRLRRVVDPVPEMAAKLWLLTHPDVQRTARVRALLDALAGSLTAQRGRLAGELGAREGANEFR